jgi:predicted XRE-type DNA-binding protein
MNPLQHGAEASDSGGKNQKVQRQCFIELGFTPYEATVMLLRAQLAEALRSWMEQNELTQAQAARKLGISQPRLPEITRGKVELLSLDYLVGLCAKAGIPVTGIQAKRVLRATPGYSP